MSTNYGLYNVVVYDGKNAYVMEFILEQSRSINTPTATHNVSRETLK